MTHEELIEAIEITEEMAHMTSREFRKSEVERITDEYIAATGRTPDGKLLERLANVILHEELTDKHPDKMSRKITADMTPDEVKRHTYPIMSDSQYERRQTGGMRKTRKDGLVVQEVPLSRAMNVAADGRNYSLPIRRVKK